MEIGSIFLILAVAVAAGLFIATPLISGRSRRMAHEAHEISSLMAERDRVINALQELDFDHAIGKIPAQDYPVQRAALLQKGADILKKLDSFALTPGSSPREASWKNDYRRGESVEDRVESAVAARRADRAAASAQPPVTPNDDEIESLIAARRTARKEKSGGFCTRCGKPILVSDRFCPHCGKAVA